MLKSAYLQMFFAAGLAALWLISATGREWAHAAQRSSQGLEKPLIFGVAPQDSPARLAGKWSGFVRHVAQALDRPVRFATAKDSASFLKRLKDGRYDAAYADPYTVSLLQGRYEPVAKQVVSTDAGASQDYGVVVVRHDSAKQTLQDLAGEEIGFPGLYDFSASILPRAHMAAGGVNHTPVWMRNDRSVLIAVTRGVIPAGAAEISALRSLPERMKQDLRVIWTTQPVDLCEDMRNRPFGVIVRADMKPGDRARIISALVTLNGETLGAAGFDGFAPAKAATWEGLAELAEKVAP